eukprot:6191790-Pleurochrysis_carterae.AAC.2
MSALHSPGCAMLQEIEFPELKQLRKIKSMQMFKKPVNSATQEGAAHRLRARLLARSCSHDGSGH